MIWLVDVHPAYQAGLDVERVAREGYSGLIVKATQGATGYTAPSTFDSWVRRARAAGMVPGAYHWLTSAAAGGQLDHYLSRLDAVGGPEGMLCAVDVEDTASPPTWAVLKSFVEGFRQRTSGHPLLLYTGAWWWTPRGWPGASLTPYLWASRYVAGTGPGSALYAKVPASWWTPGYGGWPQATLLQFSSRGQVAGQAVDVNAFRGPREQLLALTTSREGRAVATLDDDDRTWITQQLSSVIWDVLGAHSGVTSRGYLDQVMPATQYEAFAAANAGTIARAISALTDRPGGTVTLTEADRAALAADVASLLAPALRQVGQLADRLGAAGDALGQLNDGPIA